MGPTIIRQVIAAIMEKSEAAVVEARSRMPDDFAGDIHESIARAIPARLRLLATAYDEL